jgi:hypothetical protein
MKFHIKDATFAHVMLDSNGQIYVRFKYDTTNQSNLDDIKKYYTDEIEKKLTNMLHVVVKLRDESYYLNTKIPVSSNISSKTYGKILSKENAIFNLLSADKDVLYIDYLRSKSHNKTEIIDYIRARAKLGISLQEIKNELSEKQLSDAEINSWFELYISEIQALEQQIINPEAPKPRKNKTVSLSCTLRIQPKKYEILVGLDNVSSIEEANNICIWMRGTIYNYIEHMPPGPLPGPTHGPPNKSSSPQSPPKKKFIQKESSSSSEKRKSRSDGDGDGDGINFDMDEYSSDDGFYGGAGGKELHGFLIKALKKADPKVFDGPDNYSEQCQANNFRQPVVLTKDEKAYIDKSPYKNNIDSYLEYGSNPTNKNFYTCPRIWCPNSKIPLTEAELIKLNYKCPGPPNGKGEDPIHMYKDNYWHKSADTPHHIGFLAKLNKDKLCMPCCMKSKLKDTKKNQCMPSAPSKEGPGPSKPPQQDTRDTKDTKDTNQDTKPKRGRKKKIIQESDTDPKSKQETYIIDKPGILDINRYGIIPQDLHTFLYPNTPYNDCSKSISTTECIVRKGQGPVDDFLLEAVAYACGYKNKKELLIKILEVCDPFTFLSLDNGHLFTAFMEDPIVFSQSNKREIYNEWRVYLSKHINYKNMFNLELKTMESDLTNTKILRELIIFKSFKNFISYLRSNSEKNPQHLFDLLHRMGILLALWHRNSINNASLVCPTYTNLNELVYVAKQHQKVAMVLEDTKDYFYEPLEMKMRSKEGVSLFPVSGRIGSNIKDLLLHSCKNSGTDDEAGVDANTAATPQPLVQNMFVEMIRSLEVWVTLQFEPSSSPFLFKTVLLRADGKLYGFLTNNNMLIITPNESINIVPLLFKVCKKLKNIMYIEDISGHAFDIGFMAKQHFILYIDQIVALGLGIDSGNIPQELQSGPDGLKGTIIMPLVAHGVVIPLVPIVSNTSILHTYQNRNKQTNAKWFQLQHAVSNELLKYYETLVVPLLKKDVSKKTRINTLLNIWHKLPSQDKDKVQVILEELPLDTKENLVNYIKHIGIDKKAIVYTSTQIYEINNNTWLFSQAAVEEGLPQYIYTSNKVFIPNDYSTEKIKQTSEAIIVKKHGAEDETLPSLINESTGILKSLPKKWIRGWMLFKVLHQNAGVYTNKSLPELFAWISNKISGTSQFFSWNNVENVRNRKLGRKFTNYATAEEILNIDSSLFNAWNKYMGKKYKTPAEMLKAKFDIIKKSWPDLLTTHGDLIYPMDIDLDIYAQMLNISILVLFRTKYGVAKDIEEDYKRGNIEDLVTSSRLFTGESADYLERPCIILYREKEPKVPYLKYSVLLNTNEKVSTSVLYNKCLYTSVNEMPEDLVELAKRLHDDAIHI